MFSALIFDSRVDGGIPNLAAAWDGPETRPFTSAKSDFVDAKIARADISIALYKIAPDVGGLALVKRVTQSIRKAIVRMLESAPDTKTSPDEFATQMMLATMSGDALGAGDRRFASHDA
jgi:hypothetical protein